MLPFRDFAAIHEMPLPDTWDATVFDIPGRHTSANFIAALRYAADRRSVVGQGSSRVAFSLDYEGRQTILKVAMNAAGIAQNTKEADVLFDPVMGRSSVIIPGIDSGPNETRPVWIHQERATKVTTAAFERILGGDVYLLINYVQLLATRDGTTYDGKSIDDAWPDFKGDHPMVHALYELWDNLNFDPAFLRDLHTLQNWGRFQNRLVIVDLGFTSEVRDAHYSRWQDRPKTPRGWKPTRARSARLSAG